MVGAVRHFEGITMVAAKQLLFVEGDGPDQLVAIEGDRVLREDTPRNSGGTADLRCAPGLGSGCNRFRGRFGMCST